MSMIDGTVGSHDGNPVLRCVGDDLAAGHLLAVAPGHGDGLHAAIEVIESMGSANVVYARLGSQRIAVTTGPTFTGAFDDPVTLTLDSDRTLLFDPGTENRVV